MHSLEDIKRFSFPWLREEFDALTAGDDLRKIRALDVIATTWWRWAAPAIRELLPNPSPLVTEHLLHTLCALDPRIAVSAAADLLEEGVHPAAAVAAIFLNLLPPRMLDALDEDGGVREHLPSEDLLPRLSERLQATDPRIGFAATMTIAKSGDVAHLPQLFDTLHNPSPAVVYGCLNAIRSLERFRSVDAGRKAFESANNHACKTVAAEWLLRLGSRGATALNAFPMNGADSQQALIRALMRWHPDGSVVQLRGWAEIHERHIRNLAVNLMYEVVAVESGFPDADSAIRIRACSEACEELLADFDEYTRATALVVLAEADWPDWQTKARHMLTDTDVVRLEAVGLLDDKRVSVSESHVVRLLSGSDELVRQRTFPLAQRLFSRSKLLEVIQQMARDSRQEPRLAAIEFLARLSASDGYHILEGLMQDGVHVVRCKALSAGALLAPDRATWVTQLLQACTARESNVRHHALNLLGEHGDADCSQRITDLLADPISAVRRAALQAIKNLAPDRCDEHASQLLTDVDGSIVREAIEILRGKLTDSELAVVALERLGHAQGESGEIILDLIVQAAPDMVEPALARAMKSQVDAVRRRAAEILGQGANDRDYQRLRQLLRDRSDRVRLAAVQALITVAPSENQLIAPLVLDDESWEVRNEAVEMLSKNDDPVVLSLLLPRARDAHGAVRRSTILAIAKFDDRRVLSELISSLNDVDREVAEAAEAVLSGRHGPVPSAQRFDDSLGEPFWKQVRARVNAINRWAARIGRELLGKQITIQNYRQGLGCTHAAPGTGEVIVEVSDTPVTSGHPYGEEIMRGLVLHEIGHHLYDIGKRGHRTVRGIARSEGLGDLYDILLDERLERQLRARRPHWGVYFDRLASYAFAQTAHHMRLEDYAQLVEHSVKETRAEILSGRLPGELIVRGRKEEDARVRLRDSDMLRIPGLVPLMTAFLACLRCGFNPDLHPDPKVAEAVALVPHNLKDLRHRDLLVLGRAIGNLLGTSNAMNRQRKRLQRRLRRHRVALGPLSELLDRMAETGMSPGADTPGAPDIRTTSVTVQPVSKRVSKGTILRGLKTINLGAGTEFAPLGQEDTLPFNAKAHATLLQGIRKYCRRLRSYFELLATKNVEEFGTRTGHRLDLAQIRSAPIGGRLGMLVRGREELGADAYVGILVDRSASMYGDNIERAKKFCALLAESARDIPGMIGHIHAFDDETFFRMGDFQHTSVASLTADGGNNDSGALSRAAETAVKSGKRHRLLIMISDGSPTECTFESLKNLVTRLSSQYGIVCVQVAVAPMEHIAFPHFVDLSRYSLDESVARFGKMVIQLTASWRA